MSNLSTGTTAAIGQVQKTLDDMTLNVNTQASQSEHERLLGSLKYPGFNERRNQVGEAHTETFRWIFAGDGEDADMCESESGEDTDTSDWETIEGSDTSESEEEHFSSQHELPAINWDRFSNWLKSTNIVYWISGKPGSGKTTLMKYILDDPQTLKCLDIWNPGSLIISHFFWRPGTQMQQNIKGLLCSLLYQLLQSSTGALNYILSFVEGANRKDADTDWSTGELQRSCLRILASYERPVCIFLDGLDEVDPKDGVTQLLSLVKQMSQNENIKVCLASRPEPLLQNRLSIHPRLRLQDLTRGDLVKYAQDHVDLPHGQNVEQGEGDDLIWSLVDKAEGVFLWLVLATKSINKGLELGDTAAIMQERINRLPGDLTELYMDMRRRAWEDDPQEYRQTAALYFKLLLTDQDPKSAFQAFQGCCEPFNLLVMMFASTSTADQVLDAADDPRKLVPEEIILQSCRDTERRVNAYCFGLVEWGPSPGDLSGYEGAKVSWFGHKYDKIFPLANSGRPLQFIHRTAYDFLVDTAEGQEILSFDKTSSFLLEVRFIQAYLANARLFAFEQDIYVPPTYLLSMQSVSKTYYGTEAWDPAAWQRLALHVDRLGNAGKILIGKSDYSYPCTGVNLLMMAATTYGDEFTLCKIKEGNVSQDTKSEILLNACRWNWCSSPIFQPGDLWAEQTIRMLLREGADPNWQGTMLLPYPWDQKFAQLQTPFTAYLEDTLLSAYHGYVEDIAEVLKTLHAFISHGARLDANICLWYKLNRHGPPGAGETVLSYNSCHLASFGEAYERLSSQGSTDEFVLASVPIVSVLRVLLLHAMRQEQPQYGKDDGFTEMLSSLDKKCTEWYGNGENHASSRVCRFVGDGVSGRVECYETTTEHETQIVESVMDDLANMLRISFDGELEDWKRESIEWERLVSVCRWTPWSLKVIGTDGIQRRWRELGILTRATKLPKAHNVDYWVKKHQKSQH